MKRSTERILTTHVGRLQRPDDLTAMMEAHPRGRPTDPAFAERLQTSVAAVVKQQAEAGIDVVCDGEFGKISWNAYVQGRLDGYEAVPLRPGESAAPPQSQDRRDFPEFYAEMDRGSRYYRSPGTLDTAPGTRRACTGPITYTGQTALQQDIDALKSALASTQVEETFMPSTAPGSIYQGGNQNLYYPSDEAYLFALADAMKEEYQAIVAAGLVLQIDDPAIPAHWERLAPNPDMKEYNKYCEVRIEALNHALAGLPRDRVRYHVCWGSWHGPHASDAPMKLVIPLLLKVHAGALVFEAANARHEHEWQEWKGVELPDDTVLVPGVIGHATNIVEHPELVAWRLGLFASIVGKENVIGGTDCGLGYRVHPEIASAKLQALAEGARLATQELWGRAGQDGATG